MEVVDFLEKDIKVEEMDGVVTGKQEDMNTTQVSHTKRRKDIKKMKEKWIYDYNESIK